MTSTTPDPVTRLALLLGDGTPSWEAIERGLGAADDLGGLWALAAGDCWGPQFAAERAERFTDLASPPYVPPPPRSLPGRLLDWLLRRKAPGPRRVPLPDATEVRRLLADSLAALAARNLQFLDGLLAPLAEGPPPEWLTPSPLGLRLALASRAAGAGLDEPTREGPLDPAGAAAGATVADLLALHLCVEDVVVARAHRMKVEPLAGNDQRQAGGLRTESFLKLYPALRQRGEGSAWLRGLEALIAVSPLTRLVYLDVLGSAPPADSLAPLLHLGPEVAAWHELWLAHLARAVVAVVLSPPPGYEAWREARAHARHLQSRLRQPPEPEDEEQVLEVLEAEGRASALEAAVRHEYLARLPALTVAFAAAGEVGGRALHLRTLDMLVRGAAAEALPALVTEWREWSRARNSPRAAEFLADEATSCFRRFARLLFGAEWEELTPGTLDQGRADALGAVLGQRLTAAEGGSARAVAEHLGISEWAGNRLSALFQDEASGIPLPFPAPNDRGPCPADLLGYWLEPLLNRLLPGTQAEPAALGGEAAEPSPFDE